MSVFNLMFFLDCTVIGVYLALLSNIHLYMMDIQSTTRMLPNGSIAKAHAGAHFRIALVMLFSVSLYLTLKVIDTLMQVGHAGAASPMEYYINGSLVLLGVMLNMVVMHLCNEEDINHPFYSLWHNKDVGHD